MGHSLLSLLFPDACLLSDMHCLFCSSSRPGSCSMSYWCSSSPLLLSINALLFSSSFWQCGCNQTQRAVSHSGLLKLKWGRMSAIWHITLIYVPLFLRLDKLPSVYNLTLMHVGYKFMSSWSCHYSSTSHAPACSCTSPSCSVYSTSKWCRPVGQAVMDVKEQITW